MGLHQKYIIEKTNGPVDPNAKYIVLRYDSESKDPTARTALLHYCQANQNSTGAFDEQFFQDLWNDVIAESKIYRQFNQSNL